MNRSSSFIARFLPRVLMIKIIDGSLGIQSTHTKATRIPNGATAFLKRYKDGDRS